MQTGGTNQKKKNKEKETAERECDYFKSLKFNQFHLKRKNNSCKNVVNVDKTLMVKVCITFKSMVPRTGTNLQDGHVTKGTVHIHVTNDCMKKAECNPKDIIPEIYRSTSTELAEMRQFKL